MFDIGSKDKWARSNQRSNTAAAEGLAFCNALFEVERKWKDETPEQRYEARLAESQPI
ncbi:hypothetical protein E1757_24985 [Paenibacillus piri]|uniref:Uncharacterized protein n=1 Tax=Paenibacillus piri TaxID=2547395 RepID=A0A4R5KHB9_9BACL|nr:hypothetical protein E1757_24985 [Paenibacillus piri]